MWVILPKLNNIDWLVFRLLSLSFENTLEFVLKPVEVAIFDFNSFLSGWEEIIMCNMLCIDFLRK